MTCTWTIYQIKFLRRTLKRQEITMKKEKVTKKIIIRLSLKFTAYSLSQIYNKLTFSGQGSPETRKNTKIIRR